MKGDRIAFKKRPQYKKKKRKPGSTIPDVVERVRLPNKEEGEILGLVEERLPATKLRVMCADGKLRLVRIPGRLKRRTFVRPGDIIILKPWELDDDKADLVWRYFRPQAEFLQRKGYLKGIF